MPNWCNNFVEVSHEDPSKITALAEALNRGEFCDHVIPVPEVLKDQETTTNYGDPEKQARADAIRENARKATGYESWYDFCTSRWGTKWDVGGDGQADISDDGTMLTAGFDSAWAPPIGVYEELVLQGYQVRAYYYESGMCYAGIYDNGTDDCYQDWGDAQGARDTLPQDLDEMFCISESQADWEAEQEEDLHKFVREGGEALGLKTV